MSSMVGLNTLIEDLTNTGAMWIFALALVLYEYCLTFADEIDQIWSQPRPVRIRLLFAICRYWPLLNIIADDIFLIGVPTKNTKACEIWFNWYSYATIPTRCAIASLQISKLHAMYQCDKKVLITLCFVCVIELLASTAIDGYLSYTLKSTALPPPLTGCMTGSHRSFAWVFWVPGLAFESILFLFALAKLVEEATAGIRTPHLMMVLLRDLIIYFGSVTSLILANLVIWIAARVTVIICYRIIPSRISSSNSQL